MAKNAVKCVECGAAVGGDTGTSVYKHAVACLHLDNVGPDRLLAQHGGSDEVRDKRIVAMMQAAKREE